MALVMVLAESTDTALVLAADMVLAEASTGIGSELKIYLSNLSAIGRLGRGGCSHCCCICNYTCCCAHTAAANTLLLHLRSLLLQLLLRLRLYCCCACAAAAITAATDGSLLNSHDLERVRVLRTRFRWPVVENAAPVDVAAPEEIKLPPSTQKPVHLHNV